MRERAYRDTLEGLKTGKSIEHDPVEVQQYHKENAQLQMMGNAKRESFQILEDILSKAFVEAVQEKMEGTYPNNTIILPFLE